MGSLTSGYYSENDLGAAGFRRLGENVAISRDCNIVGAENISIGNNVRIDGFCSLVAPEGGWIEIGSFVHVGSCCLLSGSEGISLADFVNISHGVKVFSRNDDYSGHCLTNPTVPADYTNVSRGAVFFKRYSIVGANSVILPGVKVGEGAAVGALSLVKTDLGPWGVFCGCPAKRLRSRSRELLKLVPALLEDCKKKGLPGLAQ